jgi:hypothetical protein
MVPAKSLSDVLDRLCDQFAHEKPQCRVKLIGILFCRPQLKVAKDDILPHLRYYHLRAGRYVDFFFAGFDGDTLYNHSPFSYEIDGPDGKKWLFDERDFNIWRYELEQVSKWRYSGGNDLVLANARYDENKRLPYIDMENAICMTLEEVQRSGDVPEIGMILENIFRYAENPQPNDPVWGFSDELGKKIGSTALRKLFVSFLPKSLQKSADHAFHYAVRDLGAKNQDNYDRLTMRSKGRLYRRR